LLCTKSNREHCLTISESTRDKSRRERGEVNTDHSTTKNTRARHLAQARGQMHISSATPTGQIVSLTKRHAKAVQATSATPPLLLRPGGPHASLASTLARRVGSEGGALVGPEHRAAAPSRSHPPPERAAPHPQDLQTGAIPFSKKSTAIPHARQKSSTLPKRLVSLSVKKGIVSLPARPQSKADLT
jgi:hypothetical protein